MSDNVAAGPSRRKKAKKDVIHIIPNEDKKLEEIKVKEEMCSDSENENIFSDIDEFDDESSDDELRPTFVKEQLADLLKIEINEEKLQKNISHESNDNIKWNNCNNDYKNYQFTKENKLQVILPEKLTPYYFFQLLIDEDFLSLILEKTNEKHKITDTKQNIITVSELKIFIGLILHSGTIQIDKLESYWKKDRLFNLTCFTDYMSKERFLYIMRCFQFAKNSDVKNSAKLHKVKSLLNFFNNKMKNIYYPTRELSITKAMVLCHGHLVFKDCLKRKKPQFGLKLFMLTEPNGIIMKLLVDVGKLNDNYIQLHSKYIVLNLIEEKLNSGHSLFLDSYFNNYLLTTKLLENKTYCTGLLQIDEKYLPKDITTTKLKKYENVSRFNNGIMIGVWKDKKDILYSSTEFQNQMVTVKKNPQLKQMPLALLKYNDYINKTKNGVEKMFSYYPCSKIPMRWYKKLGIHIIQIFLLNSYYLYNKYSGSKISFSEFRLFVIKELLPTEVKYNTENKIINNNHFPTKCQTGANGKTLRKKCRVCFAKSIRRDTIYKCDACPNSPGLCLEPCFKIFHNL